MKKIFLTLILSFILSVNVNATDSKFNKFRLTVSGSGILERYTASFDTGSNIYVDKVFSTNPNVTTFGGSTTSVYLYKQFPDQGHALFGADASTAATMPTASVTADSTGLDFAGGSTGYDAKGNATTWSGNKDYNVARTPYIQSQPIDGVSHVLHNSAEVNNLFRIGPVD